MLVKDFILFAATAYKFQGKNKNFVDEYDLTSGVYVFDEGDDLIMMATDGHMFIWEKLATKTADAMYAMLPADVFEDARAEGKFPCKIVWRELDTTQAMLKAKKITGSVMIDSFADGTLTLNSVAIPVKNVSIDHANTLKALYQRMVLHSIDLDRQRVSQDGVSYQNPQGLQVLLAWINGHVDKTRQLSWVVYDQKDKDLGKWEQSFVEMNPHYDVARAVEYGAVIMVMHRPEQEAE